MKNIHTSTETSEKQIARERDKETSKFLETKEAAVLRKSYIAYLAVHDIRKLWKSNKIQIEEILLRPESDRELAYFECRDLDAGSLFKGERLREFFPKYADVKFFFTGMFVEKLIWHEKTIEKKPETCDFEVEYI